MATKKTTTKYTATWNQRVGNAIKTHNVIVTKKGNRYVDANGNAVPEHATIKPVS